MLAANVVAAADDAHALLEKARTAFLENRERERYWNWTTTSNRWVIDKDGKTVDQLPSVTVESPIRSDGKRCNAVLAWGDGREPYLANADADSRCAVEQEALDLFQVEALLESRAVKLQSRSASQITLEIRPETATDTTDPVRRCIASIQAKLELDPHSFFPKRIDVNAIGSGCEHSTTAVDHYDHAPILRAASSFRKGTTMVIEYEIQKDKSGNTSKDYWIAVHRHSVRLLPKDAKFMITWGRRYELTSSGDHRKLVIDGTTVATELAADTTLKFATDPK